MIIGCSSQFSDTSEDPWEAFSTEPKQHDVASSHLSVLSVGKWKEYKDELKPKFDLTAEKALLEILPITARTSLAKLQSYGVGLKIGADLGSTSGAGKTTKTETSETGQPTKTTTASEDTDSTSYGPMDLSKVPGGAAGILTEIKRLLDSVSDAGIKSDPLLRYLTATALYQEVQMLQRYLDDTPEIAGDYEPYIVRLQLTLMPTARNQPYDAYSDISFFIKPPTGPPSNKDLCDRLFPIVNPCQQSELVGWRKGRQPKVIPLVITDNLEAAFAQRSEDEQFRLALGIMAAVGKVGGSLDVEALNRTLQEYAGREYNSLFTVGRLSANTLRVRLGASRVGQNKYAMMTRTHQITVLLLVPKSSFTEQKKEGASGVGDVDFKMGKKDPLSGADLPARANKPGGSDEPGSSKANPCNGGEANGTQAAQEPKKDGKATSVQITVTSKTFFLDALTGIKPDDRSQKSAMRIGRRILRDWAEANRIGWPDRDMIATSELVRELLDCVNQNDYSAFLSAICSALRRHNTEKAYKPLGHFLRTAQDEAEKLSGITFDYVTISPRFLDSLWTDLLAIRASSRYASDSFLLKKKDPDPPSIAKEQPVMVLDDPASNRAWVVLSHAANIKDEITAYIAPVQSEDDTGDQTIKEEEENPCSKVICWNSTGFERSKTTGQITFLFRSLKRFKLKASKHAKLTVCLYGLSKCSKKKPKPSNGKAAQDKNSPDPKFIEFPLAKVIQASYPLPFTVDANYKRLVVESDNSAVVVFTINPREGAGELFLEVENAMFSGSDPTSEIKVSKGSKPVKLVNIVPSSIVKIYRKTKAEGRFGEPLLLLPLAPAAKKGN